jgi:hypothetical protein
VLGALRRGDYVGIKDDLRLRASGQIPEDVLAHFAHVHERSQRLRRLVKRVKRWADQLGIAVPARMKGQLRRMF